jgi:hypothetical protein
MSACTNSGASGCANSSDTQCNCICIVVCFGCSTASSVCGTLNGTSYCWQYSGPNAGKVESGSSSATCGSSSDKSWN